MIDPKKLDSIKEEAGKIYQNDFSGHDFNHALRVLNNALLIAETENGDTEILTYAALFHDLHRIRENQTGQPCHPTDSIPEIQKILQKFQLIPQTLEAILHCIAHHDDYNFNQTQKTQDLNTLILQDADNLDAIGAIGIARTFMFSGFHHIPMGVPNELETNSKYDFHDRSKSVIRHIGEKLLKLKDNMNTATGHKLAQKRHQFMLDFIDQFTKEFR